MTRPPFAEALSAVLEAHRTTPTAFAKLVHLPTRTVTALLSGRRKPPDDLVGLLTALKCNAAERQRLLDAAALSHLPAAYLPRFRTLIEDSAQLRDIRGTMVLADQLFQDNLTGKWVVAGTFARWFITDDEFTVPNLQCYIRLQVERPGRYPARIWCVDRTKASNEAKLWEVGLDLNITEQGLPVFEGRVILPGVKVLAPVPQAQRKPGVAYALQTSIWLRVGNTEVASCPLDFIFPGPPIQAGETPDDHRPSPGSQRQ